MQHKYKYIQTYKPHKLCHCIHTQNHTLYIYNIMLDDT